MASLEDKMKQLEEMSMKIQNSETSTDTAISIFKDSIKLSEEIEKELSELEEQVEKLVIT